MFACRGVAQEGKRGREQVAYHLSHKNRYKLDRAQEWKTEASGHDDRQKKMWSAAIEKRGAGEEKAMCVHQSTEKPPTPQNPQKIRAEVGEKTTALDTENGGKWMQPRLQRTIALQCFPTVVNSFCLCQIAMPMVECGVLLYSQAQTPSVDTV
eukprot:6388744-Amphidinium_carterae.1